MNEHNKKQEKTTKNMFAYTLPISFPEFLLNYCRKKAGQLVSLNEIAEKYDRKITRRAMQLAVRRLEKKQKIIIFRKEQLYIKANISQKKTQSEHMFASRHKANITKQKRTLHSKSLSSESEHNFSLGVKTHPISHTHKTISYHAVKVKVKILKHGTIPEEITAGLKEQEKYAEKRSKGWIKQYFYFEQPIPLTAELTTRSLILHFKAKDFKRTEFLTKSRRYIDIAVKGISSLFRRYGYILSKDYKIISQHIGSEADKEVDERIEKGTTASINFKRKAMAHTGEMKQKARAWLDKSLGFAEIETNDLTYEEKVLMMPEITYKALPLLVAYSEQIARHLAVMEQMSRTLDKMNIAIDTLIKKLEK